ncbi:MAG: efflux RND transporter permease subunit [Gammaproteobacteria bacterium]|nr:efflux RND transporter permease subunit [Gammaproteobacteria bacterium]MCW9004309.1 efflux RND transporter permease subunit [Gammaproteobacteria bacterium]MCW9056070.1 efflux RND transporter permease subunit [Gammaproteobacteria bacterium]
MTNEVETNNLPDNEDLQLDENNLGIAGRITRQFINSPVTPLLMLAFLGIGMLGLMFTPRQEDPQISVPMVDIFFQYPGASAEQVASLAVNPLERMISEVPGIRHVYSAASRGQGMVTAQFIVGEDFSESIVKVHDKLQSNLDKIPPGVSMPLVKPVGTDDVPVVTVTLWSEEQGIDDSMLRTLGLDVLQRLEEVPNSGKGFVVGGRAEQIRVEVSPERLSGFGISVDEVANTIKTANSEKSAGHVEGNNSSLHVYTGAFLRNAQDVSNLVVAIRNGSPVYVRDVAWVYQAPEETNKMVTYSTGPAHDGTTPEVVDSPAVTIAVAKKIGSNGVSVANQLINKLESLKGHLIPDNVQVSITRNYGKTANDKVNELLLALFEATVAVSILCLVGLGVRAASVVIFVIPIVILMTVWSAWALDYTIDRVSLFALVFTIGILVDDATVVVENIFRRWLQAGKTTTNIAIDAVREVGNPTILATLTIISALLAMGFVSGLMGPYMRPIPVLGSAAMFLSLIAAFIFAPWFAMRVRPQLGALIKAEKREARITEWIGRFYYPCMKPLCKNRAIGLGFLFLLIALTFLACSMFYTKAVTVKMLPFDNKPEFNVVVNMPDGTAMPVTANLTTQLAAKLREIPEVTAIQTYVGTASPFNFNGMVRHYYLRQNPWEADIQVMLLDKNARERESHEIAVEARALLTELAQQAGANIQVIEMPPGPPVLQTVVTEIYGPDAETRRQVARDMTEIFKQAEGVTDVDNYMSSAHELWRFEVDTEKSVRRGISVDTINRNLSMVMGGYKLGDVKKGVVLEPTYIVIQAPMGSRSQINRLGNLPITGVNGETVPLAELGRFIKETEDHIVYHKDLRAVEYVTGEMEGRLGAPIYGMFAIEDILENYVTPDGVTMTGMPMGLIGPPADSFTSGFEWTGEWTVTYETFRDMGGAFMAAMLLIYGLIVWEFKNFVLGGLIMAPIPLTLIGIIPGHWVANAEFTATSMIGFIALAGIVVRNSILLVEFVKHEVANGVNIREAVITAGKTRMRPILITALTLMAGSFMILNDLIFKGMAVSLLFGAGVATVLTLVVIPLGCISVSKQFYILAGIEQQAAPVEVPAEPAYQLPLWLRVWTRLISAVTWIYYIGRMFVIMIRMAIQNLLSRFSSGPDDSGPSSPSSGGSPGPSSGGGPSPVPSGSGGGISESLEIHQQGDDSTTSVAQAETNKPVAKTEQSVASPVVRKKAAPRKKATVTKKTASTGKEKKDVPVVKKKASTPKKRRGIRLNPGLETE